MITFNKLNSELFQSLKLWKRLGIVAILICTFAHLPICTFAQNVGISATGINPDNSAMLDVTSNTKGMLIPRMTGDEKYAIPSPATGLLVFQTDTVGFWYYDGTKWIPLVSSTSSTASPSNAGWLTTGNTGTAWNKNFLGTADSVSLRVRTNNLERMIVDSLGRVGIGTTTPFYLLDMVDSAAPTCVRIKGTTTSAQTGYLIGNDLGTSFGLFTYGSTYVTNGPHYSNGLHLYSSGSGGLSIETRNAGANADIRFFTGSLNERMRILSTGNVGIGTTSPSARFHVASNTTTSSRITSAGSYSELMQESFGGTLSAPTATTSNSILGRCIFGGYYGAGSTNNTAGMWAVSKENFTATAYGTELTFWTTALGSTTTIQRVVIDPSGNVGINCVAPQYKLHVVGNAGVVGTIYATAASVTSGVVACSDIRYKKDITPLPNALNNVMKLQGVNYHWKVKEFPEKQFTAAQQIGFIAQELEKIYPEVVMTDKDGYKSVDYSRLTPVLVEAMKEQQKIIDNEQLIIDNLKTEIENMMAKSEVRNQKSEEEIAKLKAAMEKLMQTINSEETRK